MSRREHPIPWSRAASTQHRAEGEVGAPNTAEGAPITVKVKVLGAPNTAEGEVGAPTAVVGAPTTTVRAPNTVLGAPNTVEGAVVRWQHPRPDDLRLLAQVEFALR